jgi:hypothetical protein
MIRRTVALFAVVALFACKKEVAEESTGKTKKSAESDDESSGGAKSKGIKTACDESFKAFHLKHKEKDEEFTITCPADCAIGSVWGNGWYTADSHVCSAAIHAGAIKKSKGGDFTVKIEKGLKAYRGTEANKVKSSGWGAYEESFSVNDSKNENTLKGATLTCSDTVAGLGELAGEEFSAKCPKGCNSGTLYGTGTYTTDSSICAAAVHSGVIEADDGGSVKVKVIAGQDKYTGTTKHGITSAGWGHYDKSFTVE